MADTNHYELLVIGAGPGGYVGAIRAAQLGMKTACVERDALGGVCLNWGCIPSKALLHNAELYHHAVAHGADWGIAFEKAHLDFSRVIARSRDITSVMNKGIAFLFKKNKVDHLQGHARILSGRSGNDPCTIEIRAPEGDYYHGAGGAVARTITADRILIATGAAPKELPFAPCDGKSIVSSYDAMNLAKQPKSMLVVGSGAIGMEFAYFYNALGTKVTVVEMLDRVLPVEDEAISALAERIFKKQGITFHTAHTVKAIEKKKSGCAVTVVGVHDETKTQAIDAAVVLVAVGVGGRFDGLFDEGLGVEIEKDHIRTDFRDAAEPTYQTSVPGIYAIGDVIGPPWLAHVASEEAVACVERMCGHATLGVDYNAIPGCTYCNPQVASIGLTEQAAREKGIEFDVGTYRLASHGKAVAIGAREGMVKIIASKPHGEILGAHIIGEAASELIAEMALAMRLEATVEDVISTMHAHPTMHEAIHEAALAVQGRSIHQ